MIEFPLLPSGEKPIWDGKVFRIGDRVTRVLTYSTNFAGWDDNLTELHEIEAGDGAHPIDVASRISALNSIQDAGFPQDGSILEVGCSSGFLLRDIKKAFPRADIVGADIVVKPLKRLGDMLPGVPLIQMDLLKCPLVEGQFDAVVALNVLEHIEDDDLALRQMARLLKPGGVLIVEVPQGPALFDYYDEYLRHFRRYTKSELLKKLQHTGLTIQHTAAIGFVPYPLFYLVKKLNRTRYGIKGEKHNNIETMVRQQIKQTSTNKVFNFLLVLESLLASFSQVMPGIRCTAVAKKKWPKKFPPLSLEQKWISNDFVKYWHQVLPKGYGMVERFNHYYPVKTAPANFLRTLEIGAGLGEHLYYESLSIEQEKNYIAVDIRENMVAEIRNRFPHINAIVGDCQERLDFEDNYFDRILAIHVLEHLPNLSATVRELHRLCNKNSGTLSVVIPCEGSFAYTLARRISAQRIFEKRYKQSYRWFIEREHINKPYEIFEELALYFQLKNSTYFPIAFKVEFCNLCIGTTFIPR